MRVDSQGREVAYQHYRHLVDCGNGATKQPDDELHAARGAQVLAKRDRLAVIAVVDDLRELAQRIALVLIATALLAKHCEQGGQPEGGGDRCQRSAHRWRVARRLGECLLTVRKLGCVLLRNRLSLYRRLCSRRHLPVSGSRLGSLRLVGRLCSMAPNPASPESLHHGRSIETFDRLSN